MKRLLAMFTLRSRVVERCYIAARVSTAHSNAGFRPTWHRPSARCWLWKGAGVLRLAVSGLLVGAGITAAAAQPNLTTETRLHCPAKFVTAIAVGPRGGLWASDENTGIYHCKAGATEWDSFNTANSPGLVSNHIYSLCVDVKGRLWAGTLRHGVCVYNGTQWRHYGITTGPLGSHVVAIVNNPRDGSVWMCTEAGISIYQGESITSKAQGKSRATVSGSNVAKSVRQPSPLTPAQIAKLPLNVQMQLSGQSQRSGDTSHLGAAAYKPHTWHYITRMNGLPPNPDCIAFNKQGTAFVGTLCGGLAIAHYPYTSWRVIKGPWHMPRTADGRGLPSNLINCVAVGPGGRVYVGTDLGLAISRNGGESFRYERGRDYAAKVLGLWHPPIGYRPPPQAFLNKLLPGDHITCVAPVADGKVWLGTWREGYALLNTHSGAISQSRLTAGLRSLDGYINALAITQGKLLIGRYGSGVAELQTTGSFQPAIAARNGHSAPPPAASQGVPIGLPTPAAAPSAAKLASWKPTLQTAKQATKQIEYPYAAFLRNDWRTQGDWVGRYGRQYGILCAAHFDLSFRVVSGNYAANVDAVCGPHHRNPFESMREWETAADTHNPRSLYIPQLGYRRQTNWDDHGESYPTTFQGPDLWVRLHLHTSGLYRLSLYLYNKDGHSGSDRQRDWIIEVYPLQRPYCRPMIRPVLSAMVFQNNYLAQRWAAWAMQATPLAVDRAVNFWAPLYTRFALAGPGEYMVRLVRGSSLNTEICGIFLDKADALRTQFDDGAMECLWGVNYRAPRAPIDLAAKLSPVVKSAMSVWHQAKHAFGVHGVSARWPARLLAYRAAADNKPPGALMARWRWRMDIWTAQDRKVFDANMNKAFWSMLRQWKGLKQFMATNQLLQPNSGELGNG
ncbi:MAG: hypothetical protein HKL96_07275 [Phycisphaerales bacterium]|nr:hypothetical protein [Phycisphaerales bacterium]